MKTLLATIFLCLSMYSNYDEDPVILEGVWTDYWYPTGVEGDVDYLDTMKISITDDLIEISCLNRDEYLFNNISYTDGILTFTMENTIDPSEQFFVYYSLTLLEDKNTMKGSIINSKRVVNPIKWTRVK